MDSVNEGMHRRGRLRKYRSPNLAPRLHDVLWWRMAMPYRMNERLPTWRPFFSHLWRTRR